MHWARVVCRVTGVDVHSFLARLLAAGIPPRQVVRTGFAVQFSVKARQYRAAARLARSLGGRSRILARKGLYFRLRRILARTGVFAGLVVFGLLVWYSQRFVWCIQCPGMDSAEVLQIRAALMQAGIQEGTCMTDALARTGRTLLIQQGGFGWASVNFIKGRLVVEAAPAAPVPEILSPDGRDITAAVDAVITRVQVDTGTPLVKPGDSVTSGTVLIAAARPDREGKPVPGKAQGRVWGRFVFSQQWHQPMTYEVKVPTGKDLSRRRLFVMGRWLSGPPQMPGPGGAELSVRPCTVLGFSLPASWGITAFPCTQSAAGRFSPALARDKARQRCRSLLHTHWDIQKIVRESEQFYPENGVLIYDYRAEIIAEIGQKK